MEAGADNREKGRPRPNNHRLVRNIIRNRRKALKRSHKIYFIYTILL